MTVTEWQKQLVSVTCPSDKVWWSHRSHKKWAWRANAKETKNRGQGSIQQKWDLHLLHQSNEIKNNHSKADRYHRMPKVFKDS